MICRHKSIEKASNGNKNSKLEKENIKVDLDTSSNNILSQEKQPIEKVE